MEELTQKIEYAIKKHPEKVVEFAKHMFKHDPKAVMRMLEEFEEDGGHITNRAKYDELVKKLKWANKQGSGERWEFEKIKEAGDVDFKNSDYTEFDLAYLINMLYAKCCKEFGDFTSYFKLAKCLLEDNDEETKLYRGHMMHIGKRNKQNMSALGYNYRNEDRGGNYDYDYENRRGRRGYRSEDMYEYENDNYDNRSRNENRNAFFRNQ